MELSTYTDADISLTESLECDPVVMAELGGPIPREDIPRIHAKRLGVIARGEWWFKIVPEKGGPAAGTIGVWRGDWNGTEIYETGWLILPAFQGRGLASAAARLIVSRARDEKRFGLIHAFPGVANGASNAICRKAGFERLENCDIDYAGRMLKCVHWRADVRFGATCRGTS
jgi:RimJ/RimL family protein N-acetyltransferase